MADCPHKNLTLVEGKYRCISCWEQTSSTTGEQWLSLVVGYDGPVIYTRASTTEKEAYQALREMLEGFWLYDDEGEERWDVKELLESKSDDELEDFINNNDSMNDWYVEVRKL